MMPHRSRLPVHVLVSLGLSELASRIRIPARLDDTCRHAGGDRAGGYVARDHGIRADDGLVADACRSADNRPLDQRPRITWLM